MTGNPVYDPKTASELAGHADHYDTEKTGLCDFHVVAQDAPVAQRLSQGVEEGNENDARENVGNARAH